MNSPQDDLTSAAPAAAGYGAADAPPVPDYEEAAYDDDYAYDDSLDTGTNLQ